MAEKSSVYDTDLDMDLMFSASQALDLTPAETLVLGAMIRHDRKDPENGGKRKEVVWCSPGNGLMELTGMQENSIRRSIKGLEEKGAISCQTPERRRGGRGKKIRWHIEYRSFKPTPLVGVSDDKPTPGVWVDSPKPTPLVGGIQNPENPELPPPQSPSPSPQSHPPAQPQTEEEDFLFLSPEHRSLLGELRLSRAGWQMVDDSAPELLTQALQHIESSRTEIEGAGFSREQRLGAILKGAFVLPEEPEPEPEPAKGNGSKMLFCSFCGTVYSGAEHECTEG